MNIRGILVVGILSFASSVLAQSFAPHVAWERSIPAFKTSAILSDHFGRIAVAGATSNRAGIFLFSTDGEMVASAATCFPGTNSYVAPAAITDDAGRIFLFWDTPVVQCVSLEPGLTALSRLRGGWGYDDFRTAVADGSGGVYVGFRHWIVGFSYIAHLTCGPQLPPFQAKITGDVGEAIVARSPSGNVYLVDLHGWARYGPIQVIAFTATGEVLWNKQLGPPPNEFARAAVCDSQGNLVIAGTHRGNGGPGPWGSRPLLLKLSPQGDLLWRSVLVGGDEGTHNALAVNSADEIVVTGSYGTLKYSPDGAEIWRDSEPAYQFRLTPENEVVIAHMSSGKVILRKLTGTGEELWRNEMMRVFESPESLSDFAVDDTGAVYVAMTRWVPPPTGPSVPIETIVRKYVDEITLPETKPALEVPSLTNCEPFVIGPCDVPPPPPPLPPAEVTTTRIRGGRLVVCWPTNYLHYRLEATRHMNRRKPERTRWHLVTESVTTNAETCCVTARIARHGRTFRIVPP